jgi:hypothetical protein
VLVDGIGAAQFADPLVGLAVEQSDTCGDLVSTSHAFRARDADCELDLFVGLE